MAAILPEGIIAVENFGDADEAPLLPDEQAALGRVSAKRRREFMTGRSCARRALALLGCATTGILIGPKRQPLWPVGVVGSISHCTGYCVAAVAHSWQFAAIGIDAEVHEPLPPGIVNMVTVESEREWLRSRRDGKIHWDRVLFSTKESVYKAWFSMTGSWLGFEDVQIMIEPHSGEVRACLQVQGPTVDGHTVNEFEGRFLVHQGIIVTTISLQLLREQTERSIHRW